MDPVSARPNSSIAIKEKELIEINQKISELNKKLLAVPPFNRKEPTHNSIGLVLQEPPYFRYRNPMLKQLHEDYPDAFGGRGGVFLITPHLPLLIQTELQDLYNRRLKIEKRLERS